MATEPARQTTELVHEAYLRLVGSDQQWNGNAHFFSADSEAMRRILVERARQKKQLKRSGEFKRMELDDAVGGKSASPDQILLVDDLLDHFAANHPVEAEIVKMRYFSGFSTSEAAKILGIPSTTVHRHRTFAKTWIFRELKKIAEFKQAFKLGLEELCRRIRKEIYHASDMTVLTHLHGRSKGVWGFAVSPDSKLVATASADYTVRLWETETFTQVEKLIGHEDRVRRVAFTGDGQHLVSTGKDGIRPDGKTVATGGEDGIRFWSLDELDNPVHVSVPHGAVSVDFSPDGRYLVAGGDGGSRGWIGIMDVKTKRQIDELVGHKGGVHAIRFSPEFNRQIDWSTDGNSLLMMGGNATVSIWRVPSVDEIKEQEQNLHASQM